MEEENFINLYTRNGDLIGELEDTKIPKYDQESVSLFWGLRSRSKRFLKVYKKAKDAIACYNIIYEKKTCYKANIIEQ
ncbi:hypothetical protein MXB_3006, partial [Myxobolus squamalis]